MDEILLKLSEIDAEFNKHKEMKLAQSFDQFDQASNMFKVFEEDYLLKLLEVDIINELPILVESDYQR